MAKKRKPVPRKPRNWGVVTLNARSGKGAHTNRTQALKKGHVRKAKHKGKQNYDNSVSPCFMLSPA